MEWIKPMDDGSVLKKIGRVNPRETAGELCFVAS